MATLIQIRRGTASEWSSANPTLAAGELALSTDLGQIKVGDGSSAWSSLEYITPVDTDDLTEGSANLYFTNARAISATESLISSASANALSEAQTYADALDTDDVSEGSTNLYFTNSRAIDATLATIVTASAAAVASANGYTDAQISALIDSAPGALDTLNELAAALGDDANFATTVTNSIATKLSIADASATYLTQVDAATTYDTLGSADAAQSAATGYARTEIDALDTDAIEEGSTNLYFTDQRALDASLPTISSASAAAVAYADGLTTDDIAEGTNLYFTNQRALDATEATIASASAAAVTSANGYTDTSIANLVDTAPATLDTLNELAAALGDDPNFATTVTSSIATKLDSSTASATYLSQTDASATYLTQADASSTYATKVSSLSEVTSDYTLALADSNKIIEVNSASATSITVPANSSVSFDTGSEIRVVQTGTGKVTMVPGSSVVLTPTYVAVANNSAAAATSTDGITWTARTMPSSQSWYSVTSGNGVLVAVANNSAAAATSTDGITWTARTMPSSQSWYSVTYGNGTFAAVAFNSDAAATSTDGITWTARTMPSSQYWYSVTSGNGTFVAVTYGSFAAASSTDGITWTAQTMPSSQNWYSVTYGNGTFAAVAFNSDAAATSTDGITWTAQTMPSSQNWYSVTYGNGTFAAVAYYSAAAASSTDGITWTASTMPSIQRWQSVTYGNGTFVAVTYYSEAAATSTDGITWTASTTPSFEGWRSSTYGETSIETPISLNAQNGDLDLEEQYASGTLYKRDTDEWVFIQKTSPSDQMYLRSSNNTLYKLTVDDDGSLTTTAV